MHYSLTSVGLFRCYFLVWKSCGIIFFSFIICTKRFSTSGFSLAVQPVFTPERTHWVRILISCVNFGANDAFAKNNKIYGRCLKGPCPLSHQLRISSQSFVHVHSKNYWRKPSTCRRTCCPRPFRISTIK